MTRTNRPLSLAAALLLSATAAQADVHVMVATIEGSQQVPPVMTTGAGTATITVDDVTRYVHVQGEYSALMGSVTVAHLHGLAAPGSGAPPLITLNHTGGSTGTFEGAATLTPPQVAGILDGLSYVNVHTSMFSAGEIRGQALFPLLTVTVPIEGSQEVPPVNSPGSGIGTVSLDRNTNMLSVTGSYTGLSSNITVAHLHGPAFPGNNAGVILALNHTGGTTGTLSGAGTLTPGEVGAFLDGATYLNLHSSMFGSGELRGQVDDGILGTNYCMAVPNSTGQPGEITATGSPFAATNDLTLTASSLPTNQFGYFLTSRGSTQIFPVMGSQGRLCIVGPDQARFTAQVGSTGATGTLTNVIDLGAIPSSPPSSVAAGDTWNFQAWHRDVNPTSTSNFTDAVSITFL